jgi:uridine kinase
MVTRSLAIGIAGGTGAGKTSLARLLVGRLGHATVLDLDSYYLDRGTLTRERRERLNFDEPAAFDSQLLGEHLRQLVCGHSVEKPRYSFESHTRVGSESVAPAPVIVVEGLFALWWEYLRRLFDLKVFLHAPGDVRLLRRLERDVESRGRTAESVLRQYVATVIPMHDLYVEPTRSYADLVLTNDQDLGACVNAVCTALQSTRSGRR